MAWNSDPNPWSVNDVLNRIIAANQTTQAPQYNRVEMPDYDTERYKASVDDKTIAEIVQAAENPARQNVEMPGQEKDNFNKAQEEQARQAAVNAALQAQSQQQQNPLGQYTRTSDEYYNDTYRYFRNRGMSDTQASRAAGSMAAEYKARRLSAFANNFRYGVNENGSLNNNGVYMLQQMAMEEPGMGSLFGGMYALPKQQYLDSTKEQARADARDFQREMHDRSLQEYFTKADYNYALKQRYIEDSADRYADAVYEQAKQSGYPEEQAQLVRAIAKNQYIVGSGQSKQSNTTKTKTQAHADFGYDNDTNKILRNMTDMKNMYDKRFKELLETTDDKKRQALIAETGELLSEIDDLYTKAESYISDEHKNAFRAWHYNANKARNKAAGY